MTEIHKLLERSKELREAANAVVASDVGWHCRADKVNLIVHDCNTSSIKNGIIETLVEELNFVATFKTQVGNELIQLREFSESAKMALDHANYLAKKANGEA